MNQKSLVAMPHSAKHFMSIIFRSVRHMRESLEICIPQNLGTVSVVRATTLKSGLWQKVFTVLTTFLLSSCSMLELVSTPQAMASPPEDVDHLTLSMPDHLGPIPIPELEPYKIIM